MTDCKYWKNSWGKSFAGRCSASDDVKTNAVNKWCKTPQTCPYLLKNRMNNQEILNALNEKIKAAEESLLYLKQTKEGLERVIVSTSHPPTLHDICKSWCDDDEDPPVAVLVERIKNEWLLKSVEETCGLNEYDEAYYNGWNMYRENLIKNLV